MRSYLADFNAISAAQREMDRAQALDDLNAERSGLPTGRMTRFLHDTARDGLAGNKRGKDGAGDALDMALIARQSYEALLNDTWDALRDAESAAERALQQAQDDLAASTAALQTTLDRAATLPNGTRVFPDRHDQVWTEHGERVDPLIASGIEWQGHEPTRETFIIRSEAAAHDQERITALRGHQVTLGEYRTRLSDEDNPPTRDEVEHIYDGIDQIMTEIAPAETNDLELATQTRTAAIALPGLGD